MSSSSIIDLSHVLEKDMPVFPGDKPVWIAEESNLEKNGYNKLSLNISTHTGTHVDCAYHLLPGGSDVLAMAVDRFYGSGLVIDCRKIVSGGVITRKFLQLHEHLISRNEFVLLHTGWSQFWGHPKYFRDFPVLSVGAANYLTDFKIKGVGCDTPGFDPADSMDLPLHHSLLSAGMILIEDLTNLDNLPESGFIFSCFPLRIRQGDGSPVRAIGIMTSV
jgi:kynurenine formamidase